MLNARQTGRSRWQEEWAEQMCRTGKKVAVCHANYTLVYTLGSNGDVQIETVQHEKTNGAEVTGSWFDESWVAQAFLGRKL